MIYKLKNIQNMISLLKQKRNYNLTLKELIIYIKTSNILFYFITQENTLSIIIILILSL